MRREPVQFHLDFASPYAYFAVEAVEKLAAEHGRELVWRPVLVWALLKAHGIAPPMDTAVKRAYFVHDMERSAAFYGLPYRLPVKLPLSSHHAARLWHVLAERDNIAARAFGKSVFRAFFAEHRDIADKELLVEIAGSHGMLEADAREAMEGPQGRALLEAEVARAVARGVCGTPYFLVGDEGFFGVDRLAQLGWWLETKGRGQ